MISRLKKIGRDFSLLLSAHTTQDKAIARNWIWHEDISTFWIKKYIDLKFPEHKKVCFFSCFDPRIRLAQFYPGVKIFIVERISSLMPCVQAFLRLGVMHVLRR